MNNVLKLSKDERILLGVNDKNISNIVIPSSVTTIGNSAFALCESLQNIDIPNGVVTIEKDAFNGCISLQNINLPNSITQIGSCAFANCSALQIINIPNRLPFIDDCTFSFCKSLWKITLPNSIISIGKGGFIGCKNLRDITLPNKIKIIDDGAFCGCKSLKQINIPYTVTNLGNDVFKDCITLNDIYIASEEIHNIKVLYSTFKYINFETCVLHIPSGAKCAYMNHPIFGKFKNIIIDYWKLVANSEHRLTKSQLLNTTAMVFKSDFNEDKLIARVTVGQQYKDFIVDKNCNLKAGDLIEPNSIRIYELINNNGIVIKRLWGETLCSTNNTEKKI